MAQNKGKDEKQGLAIVVIPAIITAMAVIVTGYFSYSAGRDAIEIPLRATQTAEARQPPIIQTVVITQPSFKVTQIAQVTPTLFSNNVIRNFSFEDGLPNNASLGICDNTPRWYDVCYEAPTRFKVVLGGFTGEKSMEIQIEILPEKEQVYSLRLPISPPVFADAVSANIYIANMDKFSKITLAARIKGENAWIFSDMKPSKEGWLYFLVDLQGYKVNNPANDIAIDEIHLDMFIKKGEQMVEDEQILLDDIKLYFPLSQSLKTGP